MINSSVQIGGQTIQNIFGYVSFIWDHSYYLPKLLAIRANNCCAYLSELKG